MQNILAEAIAAAGDEGIPSGHLYGMLCGILSLDEYQAVINDLKKQGRITEDNYVLRANKEEQSDEH